MSQIDEIMNQTRAEIHALAREVGGVGRTLELISQESGISLSHVTKFHRGQANNPRANTLQQLIDAVAAIRDRYQAKAA